MPVECLYRALVVDELAVVSTLSLFRVVPPHPHLVPPSFVHSPLVINPPVAHHCCRSVSAAPPGLLAYRRCRPAPSSSFGVFRPLPVPWLAWCARPWYVPVLLPNSPVGTRCADHTQAWSQAMPGCPLACRGRLLQAWLFLAPWAMVACSP